MKMTKGRRRFLEITRGHHEQAPTIWKLLRLNRQFYLLFFTALVLVFIPMFMASLWINTWGPVWMWCGLVIGIALRDRAWLGSACRNWPITDAIIDWQRVDELLAEPGESAPERPA